MLLFGECAKVCGMANLLYAALVSRPRVATACSRAEAAALINAALGEAVAWGGSINKDNRTPAGVDGKAGRSHVGRVELRALLDLIYGGPPADDSERIK